MACICALQLEIDFRLHFPDAVNNFLDEFPTWTRGLISVARLSRKADITELLRDYDSQEHTADLGLRDYLYALLALLHLLPSADTRHKAKLSSAELPNKFIWFKPQQTSLDLILSEKAAKTHKQPFFAVSRHQRVPQHFLSCAEHEGHLFGYLWCIESSGCTLQVPLCVLFGICQMSGDLHGIHTEIDLQN